VQVHFFIGSYHDCADFDVVPMQSCSLLLGRLWEYDMEALHHGRTNTYTFMHKDEKNTFLALSPADSWNHDKEIDEISKPAPALYSSSPTHNEIKLKRDAFLASTSVAAVQCANNDAHCYTMLCQNVCFTHEPISCTLHLAVTKLL
jgi:hypothetical protein